jgi:hypothetical protein
MVEVGWGTTSLGGRAGGAVVITDGLEVGLVSGV